uniref:Death domain-containing protein n=1 Tax=Laticauda laticaudata TaxID=8630 RepID=A0A8C5S467_LATLA
MVISFLAPVAGRTKPRLTEREIGRELRFRACGGGPGKFVWDGRPPGDPREDGSPISSLPETVMLMDKAPPPSRSLQQGRNLYTVINAVPVRRWKEFVRGLGLQDGEIELVELEHSQFREQQYEMLKRWCQQRGASLVAILDTLEAMQLGGCAQELKEKLQAEHLWGNP